MTRGRWLVVGLVVLLAVAGGGVLLARHIGKVHAREARCAQITAETANLHENVPLTRGGKTAVVLGDSWAAGTFLTDPRDHAWPALVGQDEHWTTYVNAIGGTGFVNGGACGGQDYAARTAAVLALHPQVVIVEGGLNDDAVPADQVRAAERTVLARLASVPTVIVVGPPKVPAAPHSGAISAALSDGAKATGRPYVSTQNLRLPLRADGLHMTPAGHPIFAQAVAAQCQTVA